MILYSSKKHTTSTWSGGTTTELFIYPLDASFPNRDFGFRLSQATVEVESSEFTPLPGIHRQLTVLEGDIALSFAGQAPAKIYAGKSAFFDGGWTTHCRGTCVDFNLMIQDPYFGESQHIVLPVNAKVFLPKGAQWTCYYLYKGEGILNFNEQKVPLTAGHILVLESANSLYFQSKEETTLIWVQVSLLGIVP